MMRGKKEGSQIDLTVMNAWLEFERFFFHKNSTDISEC